MPILREMPVSLAAEGVLAAQGRNTAQPGLMAEAEKCILERHKSASVVIGMGPGFGSHEVGSVCVYCSLRDSCWRRKGEDA